MNNRRNSALTAQSLGERIAMSTMVSDAFQEYREWHNQENSNYLDYVRAQNIRVEVARKSAGFLAVMPILDCGNHRFEFYGRTETILADDALVQGRTKLGTSEGVRLAAVVSAFGLGGHTAIDLVAWPLDRPQYVMTMFGRCGLLGIGQAMDPLTYLFDKPLTMHRTPLEWLRADCEGAVVITPHIAASMLVNLPGDVAPKDIRHGKELEAIKQSFWNRSKIVLPATNGRAT